MAIIEVNHLTKEYQLGHLTSIKETALNAFRRLTFQPTIKRERFKALDDVSFHIKEGEVVGIIGHNGAGKSTLLKHLANISKPTNGEVIVRGSIAPLIEVGAGVNPELTGRENIFLNGAILGIPKRIIQQKLDEIIDFSELEQFIDTPVKRYSSGMTVKLGFSIATSMDADILIIDEVLAVGDLAFQRKCFDRMENIINHQGKTVLLVSHNIRQLERICRRVILLENGKIIADGLPKNVCNLFYEKSEESVRKQHKLSTDNIKDISTTPDVSLKDISLIDNHGNKASTIYTGEDFCIKITFEVYRKLIKPKFGIGIHTLDFVYISNSESFNHVEPDIIAPGIFTISCKLISPPLLPGTFAIRCGVGAGDIISTIFLGENLYFFTIKNPPDSDNHVARDALISISSEWSLTFQ
ncbi:ABC transporter ATP-binding protein [Methylomonas sp. MK1]|uniref:ABC transporter ATP-binding protein n=1 Tax=Methylomonas sp. MK1 TaxID=1131552 RepID=UPI000371FF9A|nr:ABC transporter ATP-binding protein [Methylomonas sp. MK1]